MTRTLTDEQRRARRARAKRRRQEAQKQREAEERPKRPSKASQQRRAAAKATAQQIEEGKKRVNNLRTGVVWKCEMVTSEGGVEYGPMWIEGKRIGRKNGRWIAKDMAEDLARVLDLKFKPLYPDSSQKRGFDQRTPQTTPRRRSKK